MQQCSKLYSALTRRRTAPLFPGLVLLALISCPAVSAAPPEQTDQRMVYDESAPTWLRAVGRLRVPGTEYSDGHLSHVNENCSATLVVSKAGASADTIVTAWHCLEKYRDLSKPIIFTLATEGLDAPRREAYRLADGGGMHADWAILRLRSPVPVAEGVALLLHPGRADAGRAITMAGYSRDADKGKGGRHLTFDPQCRITAQDERLTDSNCLAYKGASGGAVVQVGRNGDAQLSGVVSEGDSQGFSTFVPVSVFRGELARFLN